LLNVFSTLGNYHLGARPAKERAEEDLCCQDLGFDLDDADDPGKAIRDGVRLGEWFLKIGLIEGQDFWLEFSGKKGCAVRIAHQFLGQTPLPEAESTNNLAAKAMALEIARELELQTLDEGIYGRRRMWRLTGSQHPGSGLWRTQLSMQELNQGLDWIKVRCSRRTPPKVIDRSHLEPHPVLARRWAEAIRKVHESQQNTRRRTEHPLPPIEIQGDYPPCVKRLLEDGPPDNEKGRTATRNATTFQLACYFKGAGVDREETKALLVDHALTVLKHITSSSDPKIRSSTESCIDAVFNGDQVFSCGGLRSLGADCPSDCKVRESSRRVTPRKPLAMPWSPIGG